MEELDLVYEPAYEGSKEHLELELSRRLSSEGRGPVDELQLAAYLGKTLLDKNRELEQKLKRLQKFAEDTLVANQILSRHLAESKEHLHVCTLTCEHLEARVEELNKSNDSLRKARDMRQVNVEQKSKTISDLQERIDTLEKELHLQNTKLEWKDSKCRNCSQVMRQRDGKEEGGDPVEPSGQAHGAEGALRHEVEVLKMRLQQAELQHKRVAKDLQETLAENQNLSLSLERAEEESTELQARVRYYEDVCDKHSAADTPLMSPKCSSLTSTPKHGHLTKFPFGTPGSPHNKIHRGTEVVAGGTAVTGGPGGGISLFSELDSQCCHLQSQYEDLLDHCTCPASVPHRGDQTQPTPSDANSASVVRKGEGEMKPGEEDGRPALEKPLRELFEAVFSTLRETAQVADRLIERKC